MVTAWVPMLAVGLPPAAPPATQPVTWAAHDVNIRLYNLPQRYSCDDLHRKFVDVLLVLGAHPDPKVLITRCESGSRSPGVRLQFSLPEITEHASTRGVAVAATAVTVRIEPGHPVSLQAADCELMRQIKDGLLAVVSQQVVSFNLACDAPASRGARFNLSVRTLQPPGSGARVANELEPPLRQLN